MVCPNPAREPARRTGRSARRRPISATLAVLGGLALVILFAGSTTLPEFGGLTMAVESFLPWFGLLILPVVLFAARSRSIVGWAGAGAAALAWCLTVGLTALPQPAPEAESKTTSITVATQNLQGKILPLTDPASALRTADPDLLAVQEISSGLLPAELRKVYPHQAKASTVGLLSKYPIASSSTLNLEGMSRGRALHATVSTPAGPLSVFAVHAPSVRFGEYAKRNKMLRALHTAVTHDTNPRAVVLGDFNAASTDRALRPFTAIAQERLSNDFGFGFTWPANAPVTRPDHIFVIGARIASATVLDSVGSDHRGLCNQLLL